MKKIYFILSVFLWLTACKAPPTISFQQLNLPKTPTYYLVCPPKYCNTTPNAFSPVYPVSADTLFNDWNQIIRKESRVTYQYSMPAQGQFVLIHNSLLLDLPNDITIQFIALNDQQSTLAILSQSRYGIYDFGTNQRQVNQWLMDLNNLFLLQNVDRVKKIV